MLKFIRLYGKFLLPIFVCFLAIAMLLTGYQSWMKDGDQGAAPIGRLADGRKFTLADRLQAQRQLAILGARLSDPLLLQGSGDAREEGLADRWMLLQAEADRLGVDAGGGEVNTALYLLGFDRQDAGGKRVGGLDEAALDAFCVQHQTTREGLLQALRTYLRAEAVRQLLTGTGHDLLPGATASMATPGLQRLVLIQQLGQFGGIQPHSRLEALSGGAQRLSAPLLAHQLQSLGATVSGKLVVLPADTATRLGAETEPTEAQLNELFEPLKDKPRGTAPHGFGYRLPARVKAEGVRVPVAEGLRAAEAQITQDDVREWFEKNPQSFIPKDAQGNPKPGEVAVLTLENRKKARELAVAEKGRELTLAFARSGAQALAGDIRLATANNNQLPAGTAPVAMTAAVEAVRAKHGFTPELLTAEKIQAETAEAVAKEDAKNGLPFLPTAGAAEGWMTPENLVAHPTLGMARLDEHANVIPALVGAYLAEAPERKPRLAGITPALDLALPVVIAQDGTCSILRFTAADAPRAAASLAEVRPLVVHDARVLAAYRTLTSHLAALTKNAAAADLEKFSSATDKLFAVPSLARLNPASPSTPPAIPGVGENEALQKAVFARAEALRARPGGMQTAPAEDRLVAFTADNLCSVVLFQIDSYAPIARSEERVQAKAPYQRFAVHNASRKPAEDPTAEAALKKRLGWSDK